MEESVANLKNTFKKNETNKENEITFLFQIKKNQYFYNVLIFKANCYEFRERSKIKSLTINVR